LVAEKINAERITGTFPSPSELERLWNSSAVYLIARRLLPPDKMASELVLMEFSHFSFESETLSKVSGAIMRDVEAVSPQVYFS
jgi:hypothetical protein